jgi:hypothetical protein
MASIQLEPAPLSKPGDIIAGDPKERARDWVLLGKLNEAGPGRKVMLDITGEQVVAIFGKRGTGKSYTLGTLLEGLGSGKGSADIACLETPRSCLVLDIMGIFWTSQIPLASDGPRELANQHAVLARSTFGLKPRPLSVDVWMPAGFENPAIDPPGVRQLVLRAADMDLDDWGALFGVDIYGEPRGMLIAEAIEHVRTTGYTTTAGTRVPPNATFQLRDLRACIADDAALQQNYRDDTRRAVDQRFGTFASLPLFGTTGTALTDLMRPFRVAVLQLDRVPDALKIVIVATLLRRIMDERRLASTAQKRLDLDGSLEASEKSRLGDVISGCVPRSWVLLDEAHVLAGAGLPTPASSMLVKYAKEGRNYGLSLAAATQQPSALDPQLLSQAETLIVHQLTAPSDAGVAVRAMRSPEPERITTDGAAISMEAMVRRLGQGEAIFSSGNAPSLRRACVMRVRPRIAAHGGYEA